MAHLEKRAKATLTAFEIHRGETFRFVLASGEKIDLELVHTEADFLPGTLDGKAVEPCGSRNGYRFVCILNINGVKRRLEREVSTQKSFYEPWVIHGARLWFDAVDDLFDFLTETHGECRPRKHARFVIQDATLGICPEKLHPWCPLPEGGLKISECYRGEACWLGAMSARVGAAAHGGLDINHPAGTPLWAPFDLDDHFYFNSVANGDNNNRWRGIRRWPDGSEWIIQAHHMTELTVPQHQTLQKGELFALGAGVKSGAADHSHFVFKIRNEGETIPVDPWILFWQMYHDRRGTSSPRSLSGLKR